jgi:hypothetical protein
MEVGGVKGVTRIEVLDGPGNPPFLRGCICRIHTAFQFHAGCDAADSHAGVSRTTLPLSVVTVFWLLPLR